MQITHDLKLALDPVEFARSIGFENPDPWQEKALRWSGKRAIWNVARQSGKSTTASILGLHRALYHPGSLVLLVSPSLRQSSELFRIVRGFIGQMEISPELIEDNRLSCTFPGGSRVVSLPSKEATIRGHSAASLIIIDEAARVSDDLYFTLRPMLAVSGGRLILMSTPFGKRGFFHSEWIDGGQSWERIEIKATENPRITAEFLAEERASLGDWWYSQEYEGQFVETANQVFSYDLVMSAMSEEVKPLFGVLSDDEK